MATASVTNTFVAGTAAEAAQVNTNFTDLVTFLNNSAVHRDGTKPMTGNLDLGTNKIVDLVAGTASTDAVNKTQMDTAIDLYYDKRFNYESGGGVTVSTGGSTVDNIAINAPAAGLCIIACHGSFTTSGATYGGSESPAEISVLLSVSGGAGTGVSVGAFPVTNFTSNTTKTRADVFVVPLASGSNTITVTATRTNSGSPGGTLTANTGFRTGLIGAF